MSIKIPFGWPIIDDEERRAVTEVLSGPILVHGPKATEFEAAFAAFVDAPHAVAVSSCTAGMHLLYFSLGLGAGDEVIIPAMTHVATAHAVALTGAKPVFVDAELETGNIDIDKIEAAITHRTRAIAVVHYLGMPVDMVRVRRIADRYGLFVLEDCALACGTRLDGVHAGLWGNAGVFSFYPVKHITTAEGGMVVTRDGLLADRIRLLRAFGVDRAHGERKVPGVYETVALGFNYRMSEIHAAIGIEQVRKLPGFLQVRGENYQALRDSLQGIPGLRVLEGQHGAGTQYTHSWYCLNILLDDRLAKQRAKVIEAMNAAGVGTSVYYPHPVPRFQYYQQQASYDNRRYINAAAIADRSLALPVGPHLGTKEMASIAKTLQTVIKGIH
ncbi:MAG: DegT/DnrJ/EryC1/StrS family aminotransferase [Candidatus Competibacteraceae bacterium]|nr:DegT/DnrJ/EryC1/StrS family aminotransferase [Candidatus Competibacteraceae bacterium]